MRWRNEAGRSSSGIGASRLFLLWTREMSRALQTRTRCWSPHPGSKRTRCFDVCKDERVSSPEWSSAARGQPGRRPGTPSMLIRGAAGIPRAVLRPQRSFSRPHP